MSAEAVVNEGSTCWVQASFLDPDGAPATPASVSYRIDDVTGGAVTAILESTAIAPGSSVEIAVTPTQNRILNQAYRREQRRITITATFGASDAQTEEFFYWVRNLGAVQ